MIRKDRELVFLIKLTNINKLWSKLPEPLGMTEEEFISRKQGQLLKGAIAPGFSRQITFSVKTGLL